MAKRGYVPTTEEINALLNKGDINALKALNETLAKRANERLGSLEKAGLDNTAAYNRALHYIQTEQPFTTSDRFSRSVKMDIDELALNVKEEAKFLRWQTSTVSGEVKRRDRIFKSLTTDKVNEKGEIIKEAAIKIPEGENVDSFKKTFLDFLDSDAWDEFKKHLYYTDILNEAGEAVAAGASVEDLNEAFEKYRKGLIEDDLDEIWNNWVSIKK